MNMFKFYMVLCVLNSLSSNVILAPAVQIVFSAIFLVIVVSYAAIALKYASDYLKGGAYYVNYEL